MEEQVICHRGIDPSYARRIVKKLNTTVARGLKTRVENGLSVFVATLGGLTENDRSQLEKMIDCFIYFLVDK